MATEVMPPFVAHAIQLAVAPVFLLTGIAALLGVMATRLSRVIDRARWLAEAWPRMGRLARDDARAELLMLERRRHLASWSINLCTVAALLICLVIVSLFVEEFFGPNLKWVAGSFFTLSMLAIIGGLSAFLREVYLATHSTTIDPAKLDRVDAG
jgi:hypothetical protein